MAIAVNAFTNGWVWPLGLAVGAIVTMQAGFEIWRGSMSGSDRAGIQVEQQSTLVADSTAVGTRVRSADPQVTVKQEFDEVRGSEIIGVDQTLRPSDR